MDNFYLLIDMRIMMSACHTILGGKSSSMLARLAVQWQATEIEEGEKKETPLPLSGSGVHKGDNRGRQRATEAALPLAVNSQQVWQSCIHRVQQILVTVTLCHSN